MAVRLLILSVLLFGAVTAHAQESITIEYGTFDQFDILNRNLAQGPDGITFAIATTDGSIFLWDWTTRSVIRQLELPDFDLDERLRCESLIWSPNGHYVIGRFSYTIVWDARTGQIAHRLGGFSEQGIVSGPNCYADNVVFFSADSRYVAITHSRDHEMGIYDLSTGNQVRTIRDISTYSAIFSPNNRWIVIHGTPYTEINIFDTQSDTNTPMSGMNKSTFSPDGRYFITTNVPRPSTISVFDTETMVELYQTRLHDLPLEIYRFVWLSDNRVLIGLRHGIEVSEGFDNGSEVVLWDITQKDAIQRFERKTTIYIYYQPEPDEVIYQYNPPRSGMFYDTTQGDFFLRQFDEAEATPLQVTDDPIIDFHISPNSEVLASRLNYSRDWLFWEIETGELLPVSVTVNRDLYWVDGRHVLVGPCYTCSE